MIIGPTSIWVDLLSISIALSILILNSPHFFRPFAILTEKSSIFFNLKDLVKKYNQFSIEYWPISNPQESISLFTSLFSGFEKHVFSQITSFSKFSISKHYLISFNSLGLKKPFSQISAKTKFSFLNVKKPVFSNLSLKMGWSSFLKVRAPPPI